MDGCIAGVDNKNHQVVIYDNDLNMVKSWGSSGTGEGTQFSSPDLAAFDKDGNLYILEIGNNRRIQVFKP